MLWFSRIHSYLWKIYFTSRFHKFLNLLQQWPYIELTQTRHHFPRLSSAVSTRRSHSFDGRLYSSNSQRLTEITAEIAKALFRVPNWTVMMVRRKLLETRRHKQTDSTHLFPSTPNSGLTYFTRPLYKAHIQFTKFHSHTA